MEYKKEKTIELSVWIISALLLVRYVPKRKIREAHVAFMFKQMMTWLFGLVVVENDNINYPYRTFFKKTLKSSFTFEYFAYPALCAIFNVHYPEKSSASIKFLYFLFHTSIITFFEVLILKYTKLIHYEKWSWYWTFTTIWLTYYISHIHNRWFFGNFFTRKKILQKLFYRF